MATIHAFSHVDAVTSTNKIHPFLVLLGVTTSLLLCDVTTSLLLRDDIIAHDTFSLSRVLFLRCHPMALFVKKNSYTSSARHVISKLNR